MFEINTLGNFDIKYNDQSILDTKGYPYKTLKLFKYFLTHEGKKLLPENIIDDILEEYEYKDPSGALRTQISRVRKMIDLEKISLDNFFKIEYKNGYYIFILEENCTLDIKEFESKMKILEYEEITKKDEEILINTIFLYQGRYLQELEDEDWIVPIRSRIDRLYIKALGRFLQILKERIRYEEIIAICEDAMKYNFYEETIHTYFLDALMCLGQKKYAVSHYEFYTTKFYHDLGVAPSRESREIYKQLCSPCDKKEPIVDLNVMNEVLKEDNTEGALICDPNYFKFLYKLESRHGERNKDSTICLGIVTIDSRGYKALEEDEAKVAMNSLKDIMFNALRKGDVLSQWNDSQLVFLLYNIQDVEIDGIMERLKTKFETENINSKATLNIKCKI